MKVAFQSSPTRFLVQTGERGGLPVGFLLDLDDPATKPIVPLASIAAHCPQEDFQPFHGDQAPILAHVEHEA